MKTQFVFIGGRDAGRGVIESVFLGAMIPWECASWGWEGAIALGGQERASAGSA